jgi:hypothetical protein
MCLVNIQPVHLLNIQPVRTCGGIFYFIACSFIIVIAFPEFILPTTPTFKLCTVGYMQRCFVGDSLLEILADAENVPYTAKEEIANILCKNSKISFETLFKIGIGTEPEDTCRGFRKMLAFKPSNNPLSHLQGEYNATSSGYKSIHFAQTSQKD